MSQHTGGHAEFGPEIEPGYKNIFYIVFGVAVLYIAIVLLTAS